MIAMELISQDRDKQGRPVLRVSISDEEVATIKDAIAKYPKEDKTMENRLEVLSQKLEWNYISQQNIRDIQEVVNWNIQNLGSNTLLDSLSTKLHEWWVLTNPS